VWNVKANVHCGLWSALSEGLKGSLENTQLESKIGKVTFRERLL